MKTNRWKLRIEEKLVRYPEAKNELELAIDTLLDRYLRDSDDYIKEKFCKAFCASIFYLKTLLEERKAISKLYCDKEAIIEINEHLLTEIEGLAYNFHLTLSSM